MTKGISAAKAFRQSLRRREENRHRIRTLRTLIRGAREGVAAGAEDKEARIKAASVALDRAASRGVLHRNNASRRKSRLALMLNRASAEKVQA
ncbi:MAG: 30S ribosomal protein S20 [Chloroflexi bacterium]|nr:30S ribosomal protein S20 [Chloroflexota bacterium]